VKRFQRWTRLPINALAVLSLILCFASVVAWAKSGFYLYAHATNTGGNNARWIAIKQGQIQYISRLQTHRPVVKSVSFMMPQSNQWPRYEWGATWTHLSTGGMLVQLPLWWLTVVFAIPPILRIYQYPRLIHRARSMCGHCPTCNYDLRATPSRCPECGTMPPKTKIVST